MAELRVAFVAHIPRLLDTGVLYVSQETGRVAHVCPCEQRHPVVVRVGGDGWNLAIKDEKVTLHPSLLNRPCQEHYWIRDNRIVSA